MPFLQLDKFDRSGFEYGRPGLYVLLWFLVQDTLFRFSPLPCYGFRRWLLRLFGARVGRGVLIRPRARIHYPWRLEIGDYSWVGDDAWLYSLGEIRIGAHSAISQKCFICTSGHDFKSPYFKNVVKPIVIGSGVWVAADVFVAPGVTIGDNAVIGARSTVFRDMPADTLCYGNPCRPVRKR